MAGCFNPDDILPVHGTLTSPDPVTGQIVRLLRDPAPLRSSDCSGAKPFKEVAVDVSGAFSFDVFRAQATKLSNLGQFCFRVETTFPSGTSVFSDILGLAGEVSLPPFPDWRAQPARVDGVLRFEPASPLPMEESFEGDQLVHRAEWFTEDGGLAWVADDRVLAFDPATMGVVPTRQAMPFDDFALEDFSGTVTLRARMTTIEEVLGPFGEGATTIEVRSGQKLQLTGTRTPFSRGLECLGLGTACPLTDGDLTPQDAGSGPGASFTFPAPRSFSTVVVRGVETEAVLMGMQLLDADGGTARLVQQVLPTSMWNSGVPNFVLKPLPDGGVEFSPKSDPRFFTFSFDAGVAVREVRMGFAATVERISEVSLFE